eukprot:2595832-Pyramimonas_sp.AAC.1
MDGARELLTAEGLSAYDHMEALCHHDVRLIYAILKKGRQSREAVQYENLQSAGQVFVDYVAGVVKRSVSNPCLGTVAEIHYQAASGGKG